MGTGLEGLKTAVRSLQVGATGAIANIDINKLDEEQMRQVKRELTKVVMRLNELVESGIPERTINRAPGT